MERNKYSLNVVIICATALIAFAMLMGGYKNRNRPNDIIAVTGLGSQDFESDLITWSATYSTMSLSLSEAFKHLSENKKLVQDFLVKRGVDPKEIKFSAVATTKEQQNVYGEKGEIRAVVFKGNRLTQTVNIESKDVDKIEEVSREITELLNRGVELSSSVPQYFYTKLAELKLQLIEKAAADARQRADKIAGQTGSDRGKIRYANMGVFQITAQNSNEDFSWGGTFNTQAKKKSASITMKIQFGVD